MLGQPKVKGESTHAPFYDRVGLFLLLAVGLYALMPVVHEVTFGEDRIINFVIQEVQHQTGSRLSDDGQEMITQSVRDVPASLTSAIGAFRALFVVLISSGLLYAGAALATADHRMRHAVGYAAFTVLVVGLIRAFYWGVMVLALGLDNAVARSWTEVAEIHAGLIVTGPQSGVIYALLGSFSYVAIATWGLFAAGLKHMAKDNPDFGWGQAVALAAPWPLLIMASTFTLRLFIG